MKYRIKVSALAVVTSWVEVETDTISEVETLALQKVEETAGDLDWKYEGLMQSFNDNDDDYYKVDHISPERVG